MMQSELRVTSPIETEGKHTGLYNFGENHITLDLLTFNLILLDATQFDTEKILRNLSVNIMTIPTRAYKSSVTRKLKKHAMLNMLCHLIHVHQKWQGTRALPWGMPPCTRSQSENISLFLTRRKQSDR